MHKLLLAILFIHGVVTNAYIEENLKTLHGYKDPPDGGQKTLLFEAEPNESRGGNRQKRAAESSTKKPPLANNGIITKVRHSVDLFATC